MSKAGWSWAVVQGARTDIGKPKALIRWRFEPIRLPKYMYLSARDRSNLSTIYVGVDPHFELSMICCAFLIADSSGDLSFFRMSIVFCAEAVASFLLPSFA